MKQILAIFLLLSTAFYVLPVTNGLIADNETTCKCVDEKTDVSESDSKKETGKEFITNQPASINILNKAVPFFLANVVCNFTVHHSIETPPPDQA